jgi:hypothetical protein
MPKAGTCLRISAAALAVSFALQGTSAMGNTNSAKPHRYHHAHHAIYWEPGVVRGERLPYGPEHGFLSHVPPNAIRMPGYTFVPGVGILGESCDLPTSACSNQYRDVQ